MKFVIAEFKFPVYGICILMSLIIGISFNFYYLMKSNINKKYIYLYMFQFLIYCVLGGLIMGSKKSDIGLASYGGAIGVLLSAFVFEHIYPKNNTFIKSAMLSLPLMYSISKIGCFLAGCCYGIPYDGIFSVTYTHGLNISLVPVQLMETITFMIIFIICLIKRKNKDIIAITMIMCATGKFLLDFLRYEHIGKLITFNQLISIVFIIIGVVIIIKNKSRKNFV